MEPIVRACKDLGLTVFYDRDSTAELWGRNFVYDLRTVYSGARARYFVPFLSVIPGEPHFSAIVKASAAITAEMPSRNVIDTDRFPPHLSLHICTIPNDQLACMFTHLATTAPTKYFPRP